MLHAARPDISFGWYLLHFGTTVFGFLIAAVLGWAFSQKTSALNAALFVAPLWFVLPVVAAVSFVYRTPNRIELYRDRLVVRCFTGISHEFMFASFAGTVFAFDVERAWRDLCLAQVPAMWEWGNNFAASMNGFVKVKRKGDCCGCSDLWICVENGRIFVHELKSNYDHFMMSGAGGDCDAGLIKK